MNNKLVLGTFNSERLWQEGSMAGLPGMTDIEANNIVSVMDELLFVFCETENDVLITRYPKEKAFIQYLKDIGFNYKYNSLHDQSINKEEKGDDKCIFELLAGLETPQLDIPSELNISSYSITPSTDKFCNRFGIKTSIPAIDVIKKINSKEYSHDLNKKLGIDIGSVKITNSVELELLGIELLKNGPIIIKEYMGVSGKGNQLIDSEFMLKRLAKYFSKQESKNRSIGLIIEPFIKNKTHDFSCQLNISEKGEITFLSLQEMVNEGFSFKGIREAGEFLTHKVNESNYFDIIKKVASEIITEGYHGPLCIDSMLLDNNKIVPVVEINARKSMGLINYQLDKFLKKHSSKGMLMFYNFITSKSISFEDLLYKLEQNNNLFTRKSPSGILPLSSTSLNLNFHKGLINNNQYKGRFYFSVISNNIEEEKRYLETFKQIALDMELSIIN